MGDQGSRLRDTLEAMLGEYYPRDDGGALYLPPPGPPVDFAKLTKSTSGSCFCGAMVNHDPGDEDRS